MERLQNRLQKVPLTRYASLYFITIVDKEDNELLVLEMIHFFVEILDKYFNNVCELDLIFNFHKVPDDSAQVTKGKTDQVYYILDEMIMSGHIQESSKKVILKAVAGQEHLIDEVTEEKLRR